ncbi:MAG: hypothetical protein IK997_04575 [Bacilli bacterium]|nr:hypothetical protein [Bacilli bacterium]
MGIGKTKIPQITPGANVNIVAATEVKGTTNSSNSVTTTPEASRPKSKGLKTPNISCPCFVFAGIK